MRGTAIPTAKQRLKDKGERMLLIEQLKKFDKMSDEGLSDRVATMRKGNKLFRGQMWEDGITSGRLAITANQAVALGERFLATISRARPIFEIQAIRGNDDDGARLIEGALLQNFKKNRMGELIKSGGRMAMFTYPAMWYSFWDTEADQGRGRESTRCIAPHMMIIDKRRWFLKDMEFKGFKERMSLAKLIRLFPDSAEELEAASASSVDDGAQPGKTTDPFATSANAKSGAISRVVADNQGVFTGKTSVKVGGFRKTKGLAEERDVRFMWYDDPTPKTEERAKRDYRGMPMMKATRHPESGEYQFEHTGHRVVQGVMGPRYIPNLKLKREPIMETVVSKKYPGTRHVAWVPDDNDPIILWDVNWKDEVPLVIQRISLPLADFWLEGPGLRLTSLAVARNILYTIIFQRLKLSLSGTWLATTKSGLRRNKLNPEDGQVFYAKQIGNDDVRQFPVQPVDSGYFQLLNMIESEMMKLIGLSEPMRGNSAGRADSSATYESLIEQGGVAVVDAAQLLEQSLEDWARIQLGLMQKHYTHEHFVEFEEEEGTTSWRQAHAIAVQGEFSLSVEPGSMFAHSESAQFEHAKEAAALGFYALPMLGRIGHIKAWKRALKQKMALMKRPDLAFLLGAAGAPPGKSGSLPTSQKRDHHGAGAKK